MVEEMRIAALKLRTAEAQPFYAMSEVANFFETTVSSIFPVYRTLAKEGTLNCIRGSVTMLNGEVALPRESVRGVVGLVVGLEHIGILAYTKTFIAEIEERLSKMRYIAEVVFNDGDRTRITEGLLRRRLDVVILHSIPHDLKQSILTLREGGVRLVLLQRKDTQIDLPGLIYLIDCQTAYSVMAARWRETGIRTVWLHGHSGVLDSPQEVDNLKMTFQQQSLQVEVVHDSAGELLQRVRRHRPRQAGVVAFLDSVETELFCNRDPEILEKISHFARLAFCAGRLRLPGLEYRKVPLDIVEFSPTEAAARLADDIARLPFVEDGICGTFFAAFNEQVLL